MDLTIGVIAPTSQFLPQFNLRLCYALEAAFGEGSTISVVKQAGGFNSSARVLKDKIEQMQLEHNIDVLVVPLNTHMLEKLTDTINACQIPTIVLNLGENASGSAIDCPYIWLNSYGLWKSQWLLGKHCGELGYKKPFSLNAYHDSGYGSSFAFSLGLESTQGAIQQYLVEQKIDAGINNWHMLDDISIDAAFISSSGTQQQALLAPLNTIDAPVFANSTHGYTTATHTLNNTVWTCSTWNTDDNNEASHEFIDQYQIKFKAPPNAYDMLAYETGLLLQQLSESANTASRINEQLSALTATGPRGAIRFDGQTVAIEQFYLRCTTPDNQVTYTTLQEPELLKEQYKRAQQLDHNGWLNPYLIA